MGAIKRMVNVDVSDMRWKPLPLDYLLSHYSLKKSKTLLLLAMWFLLTGMSIASVLMLSPYQSLLQQNGSGSLNLFFMMYPPLILGTLLVFWLGFEWGFIPVFLSAFLVAFTSGMTLYWAILFAIAFVLGLAIYALAYHCTDFTPQLNSVKSFTFFTVVSFIAAIASSLGSFVWSLNHDLSATGTVLIWKGWWTGVFLQSMLIVAPFLLIFTPTVERIKKRYFSVPDLEVSMKWVYTAIISVVVVLTLFIIGGKILGSSGIEHELANMPEQMRQNILRVSGSFQIISWISIAIVVIAGLGGIYLVGSWNHYLRKEVDEKTQQLQVSEERLMKALDQKEMLLKEIHDRVRNNLTMMLALLELQLKNKEAKSTEDILRESHSRIRSMAIIHETMHESESVETVNLKKYAIKLSNRLRQAYEEPNQHIDVRIKSDDLELEIDRAVPFAMILNELMVNSYTHAFNGQAEGAIFVQIQKQQEQILLSVRDNGSGLPGNFETVKMETLGMKLIHTLTRQLHGKFRIENREKARFSMRMPVNIPPAGAGSPRKG